MPLLLALISAILTGFSTYELIFMAEETLKKWCVGCEYVFKARDVLKSFDSTHLLIGFFLAPIRNTENQKCRKRNPKLKNLQNFTMHYAMRMQRFPIFSSNILRLYVLFLCAWFGHDFVFDIFDFLYFQSVPIFSHFEAVFGLKSLYQDKKKFFWPGRPS